MRRVRRRGGRAVRRFMRRPQAGPVLAGVFLAVFLAAFTWSCQSLGRGGGMSVLNLSGEPDINVRIRHGVERVTLSGPRLVFITEGGSTGGGSAGALLRTPVVVTRAGSGLAVAGAGGESRTYAGAIEVTSGAPRIAGVEPTVAVDGTGFPGRLRIMGATAGADAGDSAPRKPATPPAPTGVDVVAAMGLETYLPGVLAKELPAKWPEQTNRVEAVCARSYALHQRARARASGREFDVESSTRDQAYTGDTSRPEAVGAVRATRGEVLVYSGPGGTQLLRAYYSSTCGGRAASAADVWPTGSGQEFNRAGPIQGRPREWACQSSPVYRWTVARDRAELEQRLRAWGAGNGSEISGLGSVASIRMARAGATGRPSRYAVTDSSGRKMELTAEELRVACNTEAPGLPAPERTALVRSGDFEAVVAGDVVTFNGRGFGHGVGMCQYCAKGMAERGMDYQRMLALFYPGARVERAY